jgi:hypothetical protein
VRQEVAGVYRILRVSCRCDISNVAAARSQYDGTPTIVVAGCLRCVDCTFSADCIWVPLFPKFLAGPGASCHVGINRLQLFIALSRLFLLVKPCPPTLSGCTALFWTRTESRHRILSRKNPLQEIVWVVVAVCPQHSVSIC